MSNVSLCLPKTPKPSVIPGKVEDDALKRTAGVQNPLN